MRCLGRAKTVIPKNAQTVAIIYDQSFLNIRKNLDQCTALLHKLID